MSRVTDDPDDPRIGRGVDDEPVAQNEAYLVLSDDERKKGFVRPVRRTYRHVGQSPKYPLRELTEDERDRYSQYGYVAYEAYPESESPKSGRYWTQAQLAAQACGGETTMGLEIAETYAHNPQFYGSTYCVHCGKHRPVAEFVWDDGSVVGS